MTIQVYLLLKNKRTGLNSTFTFKKVDKEQISIVIKRLDSKKVSKSNEIPLRIIKEFSDIFGGFLTKNFNECLDKAFSQMNLNVQRMSQLKNNSSPVSILSNTSKLYEDPVQGFSAQHCLLVMVEKMKKVETTKKFLLRFSLNFPKLLTAYLTVY